MVIEAVTKRGESSEGKATELLKKEYSPSIDWLRVGRLLLISREIDRIETEELVPNKKVFNQFCGTGHELAQIILGQFLTHPKDAVCGYYRSRALALSIGVPLEDIVAAPLGKSGSFSNGRDVGVVFNYPNLNGVQMLPTHGGVGAQYTPTTGWARAIAYYNNVLKQRDYNGAVAVACGGDASVATNGFWSAINTAAVCRLPQLFFIEDNGLGISVPSNIQTPGGNIAKNLASFTNLGVLECDGSNPKELESALSKIFSCLRNNGDQPWLLRVKVPRICGHTYQDNQSYRSEQDLANEIHRDPLYKLRTYLVSIYGEDCFEEIWQSLELEAKTAVARAYERAEARANPDPNAIKEYVFSFPKLLPELIVDESGKNQAAITMLAAIRKTLEHEMVHNPKLIVFGEDVGRMGGVHAATLGLQKLFGRERVFDTSLSEEGIIGNAVGMAYAGLKPVPEIQFRKYADAAVEQLRDCGTVRWRTNNRFEAPIVVRIPVGYGKRGDLWHAETDEVEWIHSIGWQIAYPSNAQDAAGLLRFALRDDNPTLFFEHRYLLDSPWAKRRWPGTEYVFPFGKAKRIREGSGLTVISWGACVEECDLAISGRFYGSIELIDLCSLKPWDLPLCAESVKKTGKCLIVHEDYRNAGFGAEIVASLMSECFYDLNAPIERIAKPDIPCPHQKDLLNAAVPRAARITDTIENLLAM